MYPIIPILLQYIYIYIYVCIIYCTVGTKKHRGPYYRKAGTAYFPLYGSLVLKLKCDTFGSVLLIIIGSGFLCDDG